MFYERELDFLIRIFNKCNLPVFVIDPSLPLAETVPSLVKKMYLKETDKVSFHDVVKRPIKEHTLYKMKDILGFTSLFLALPGHSGRKILFAGPYLTDGITDEAVLEKAEHMGFDAAAAHRLQTFFSNVIVLPEDSRLFASLDAFCDMIWGDEGFSHVNVSSNEDISFSSFTMMKNPEEITDPQWEMEQLEKRYAFENQFMEAVTRGQTYKVEKYSKSFTTAAFEQRLPDGLRNSKNYMIIMNTLLRKAAEKGGVHPVYLDSISSQYARKIEACNTVSVIGSLMKAMFTDYCVLVNKHSTSRYSKLVRSAIIYIDSDLTADLSLKNMAKLNGVSASYLSTCFKQETGINYADYVNRSRIRQAKHLLKTTRLQIQTVAQHCGFVDIQYFVKVFKKYTGKTPRQYREISSGKTV